MSRMIFVNLPVQDVRRSETFFAKLGFSFNRDFCDANTLCLAIDDNIFAMLLNEEKFASFINDEIADATKTTEVLTCLTATGRDEIDALVGGAVEAGGSVVREPGEEGLMYGGSFADPDGHVWELIHMDQVQWAPAP